MDMLPSGYTSCDGSFLSLRMATCVMACWWYSKGIPFSRCSRRRMDLDVIAVTRACYKPSRVVACKQLRKSAVQSIGRPWNPRTPEKPYGSNS